MTANNSKLDLYKLESLGLIKGHNFGTNVRKMICNNPKLDLVYINACIKFGEILSICSQDIERKRNFGVNHMAIHLVQMCAKNDRLQSQPRFHQYQCIYIIW